MSLRYGSDGHGDAASGEEPCSSRGCGARTGTLCSYVDRRSRPCRTAWCPEHAAVVAGRVYCRRHAGTMRALADQQVDVPLPDLDNRASSLVEWVGHDLDGPIRAALETVRDPAAAQALVANPVHLSFRGRERVRVWERSWKLTSHAGVVQKVLLQVEEDQDSEVVVRVGDNVVVSTAPPWVDHQGPPVSAEEDAERRRRFYDEVTAAVTAALRAAPRLP